MFLLRGTTLTLERRNYLSQLFIAQKRLLPLRPMPDQTIQPLTATLQPGALWLRRVRLGPRELRVLRDSPGPKDLADRPDR